MVEYHETFESVVINTYLFKNIQDNLNGKNRINIYA